MSDALREAAIRIRRIESGEDCQTVYERGWINATPARDNKLLAQAWLAANPPDAEEQVTSTWLVAVLGSSMRGAICDSQHWFVQFWETQRPSIVFRRDEYREDNREDECELPECETRGAVRRLCKEFNIVLREEPAT